MKFVAMVAHCCGLPCGGNIVEGIVGGSDAVGVGGEQTAIIEGNDCHHAVVKVSIHLAPSAVAAFPGEVASEWR